MLVKSQSKREELHPTSPLDSNLLETAAEAEQKEQQQSTRKAKQEFQRFLPWVREANSAFKSWAIKMSSLHRPTWRKAGIFEAVMASTKGLNKDTKKPIATR
ncbi:hypothetical protein HID58_035643 [Brassica napus]|uniref:Uncharacterized protein n=1 Tax=Brassica napus TaxID=3708 RepID=A0ABQ8C6D8_BRANA|nr:hypothetical protein HID58_035643 [Brassica napus]